MSSQLNTNRPCSSNKQGQASVSTSQNRAAKAPVQHPKSFASSSIPQSLQSSKASPKPEPKPFPPSSNSNIKSSHSPKSSGSVNSPKHSSSSHAPSKSGDHIREHHTHQQPQGAPSATDQVDHAPTAFAPIPQTHYKCRKPPVYARAAKHQPRIEVPDEYVSWSVPFPGDYVPLYFTDERLLGEMRPPYADADINPEGPAPSGFLFNELDGKIDRRSHTGPYKLVDNMPQNPVGRTGLRGRGVLGRWGPNHAADPIVTRWKRDARGEVVRHDGTGLPILQFLAIERRDNHEWAIPGGMVDAGEKVATTLRREFCEEAMDMLRADEKRREELLHNVDEWFAGGVEVYRGYVDDPRNTDNAWMETVAYNFHDEAGNGLGHFEFRAGDDAVGVRWMDLSVELQLYASHSDFMRQVARRHGSHWG